MLFKMPTVAELGARGGRGCAVCGSQVAGAKHGDPTLCVFCAAWVQWRRQGDERWAQARSDQGHGGRSTAHAELVGLAARP